jgi:hypothetical protein
LIQALLGIALVLGISVAMGFRTSADPLAWLAAIGILVLVSLAITWLSVALGLVDNAITAIGWGVGITALSYLWAQGGCTGARCRRGDWPRASPAAVAAAPRPTGQARPGSYPVARVRPFVSQYMRNLAIRPCGDSLHNTLNRL